MVLKAANLAATCCLAEVFIDVLFISNEYSLLEGCLRSNNLEAQDYIVDTSRPFS